MTKTYLKEKAIKTSFALKGIGLLIVLAIIFGVVLIRFALSGRRFDYMKELPDSDEAYSIAKEFVKPTIKSSQIYFPEFEYQCAKKPDSVYIVKSYAEAKNQSGIKNVIPFEITLKYNGGQNSSKKSWTLLNLSED